MKYQKEDKEHELLPGQLNFIDFLEEFNKETKKMTVEDFMELLSNCYAEMEIVVETEGSNTTAEVVAIDIDEEENMAIIRVSE